MTPEVYIKKAKRTENGNYKFKTTNKITPRLEHAILGIATEAGELLDIVKKNKVYGKDFDKFNIVDEVGDLMWYIALLAYEINVPFEEIWEQNIKKLRIRYPEKFKKHLAINKDTNLERIKIKKQNNNH